MSPGGVITAFIDFIRTTHINTLKDSCSKNVCTKKFIGGAKPYLNELKAVLGEAKVWSNGFCSGMNDPI